MLMNAGLEAEDPDALAFRIVRQVVEHQLPETPAAKLRSHPHSLDFAILGLKQLDATTAGRRTPIANHEKGNRVGNQFLDAKAVTALARIERRQMRVELRNQRRCFGTRRMLRGYDDCHVYSVGHQVRCNGTVAVVAATDRSPARSAGRSHTNTIAPRSTAIVT